MEELLPATDRDNYEYDVKFVWIVETEVTFRYKLEIIAENYRTARAKQTLVHPPYERLVMEIGKTFPSVGQELVAARASLRKMSRPGVQKLWGAVAAGIDTTG